jgi:hypothetical protein
VGLRDWLAEHQVTQVTMEATRVYWKPVWSVLEDAESFELVLVNGRHVKNLPGERPTAPMPRGSPVWPGVACCGGASARPGRSLSFVISP